MLDKQTVLETIKPILAANATKGSRFFEWRLIDGRPAGQNMLGCTVDHHPFTGKVVGITEDVTVIKAPRKSQFVAVANALMTESPKLGKKVDVIPYARRRFDGSPVYEPVKQSTQFMDGLLLSENSMILGDYTARIPGEKVACPELRQLVNQLQELPAPDGYRRITHMLVDAGASVIEVVDPKPDDIIKTPPVITFALSSSKFTGNVSIRYIRITDTYAIEFRKEDGQVLHIDPVYFDDLGQRLADVIDDESWQRIRVVMH